MSLIDGTCVAINNRGVLIRGPSGSGKSDLALRLIDEGAQLVSDDYCETRVEDGILSVSAPATIAGKLEVRGYGIVTLQALSCARVDLVVDLLPEAEIERMPESSQCVLEGITLRCIALDARSPSAASKVRLALSTAPEQTEA